MPPFGAKTCSNIFPRRLSVLRSEQFSKSLACGKLLALRNIDTVQGQIYGHVFAPYEGSVAFISLQISFETLAVLKTEAGFSWGILSHLTHVDQFERERKYFMGPYNLTFKALGLCNFIRGFWVGLLMGGLYPWGM